MPPLLHLPASGLHVQAERARRGRTSLEVRIGSLLVDVCTTTCLGLTPLRGAWRGGTSAGSWAVAWGQLPPEAEAPDVKFVRGWSRKGVQAQRVLVHDGFWVAESSGVFHSVAADIDGERLSGRLRRARLADAETTPAA
ncbi:hypothetical protein [Streptomyces sp. UNOC14_S4]|uniref:hypothetical protein n=1 Tax=Streptomyces sp. UNOC14_S4 TaxID=2872340 RepID=UPI001E520420|nr:hypothetical protein [Streptomyces sp. UNOC14_S4]MCC3767178.1 hypothetical protein [Streptomyces sp. UNOC14_S4]